MHSHALTFNSTPSTIWRTPHAHMTQRMARAGLWEQIDVILVCSDLGQHYSMSFALRHRKSFDVAHWHTIRTCSTRLPVWPKFFVAMQQPVFMCVWFSHSTIATILHTQTRWGQAFPVHTSYIEGCVFDGGLLHREHMKCVVCMWKVRGIRTWSPVRSIKLAQFIANILTGRVSFLIHDTSHLINLWTQEHRQPLLPQPRK